jgi:hypothetical protein
VTDILDEVESEYRSEQLRAAAARYAWVAIALLVIVLAAVGGYQLWEAHSARAAGAAADIYLADSKAADALVAGDAPGHAALAERFGALAATAPAGYRTLARLREAGLLADAGKIPAAQAVWDKIITDPDTDPLLRQWASLLWVERGLDTTDPDALRTRLLTITAGDNPYHTLGEEAEALLDVRVHKTDEARKLLRRVIADPTAPNGLRERDAAILSHLGG